MNFVTFIPTIHADRRIFNSLSIIRKNVPGTFIRFLRNVEEIDHFLTTRPDLVLPQQTESGWYIWGFTAAKAEAAKQAILDIVAPQLCLYVWEYIKLAHMPTAFSAMAYSKQQAIESIVASLLNYHKFGKIQDPYTSTETWEARQKRREQLFDETVPSTLSLEGSFCGDAWKVLEQRDDQGELTSPEPDTTKIIAELEQSEPKVFRVTPGFVIFSSHLDG